MEEVLTQEWMKLFFLTIMFKKQQIFRFSDNAFLLRSKIMKLGLRVK